MDKEQLCGVLRERCFSFELVTELQKALPSSMEATELGSETVL